MLIKDIIINYGQQNEKATTQKLAALGNSLFGNNWKFWPEIKSETKIDDPCFVNIGDRALLYNCDKNKLSSAGYILAVEHMFHEQRHVEQLSKEINIVHEKEMLSSDKRMTDIVRRNFIAYFYAPAYKDNYQNDPGEMDAEVHGIENAIKYFELDPFVSQTEANEILFQIMMSEEYGHRKKLEPYNPKSIEDVLNAFIDLRAKTAHTPYPVSWDKVTYEKPNESPFYDITEEILSSSRYKKFRDKLEQCTDGREQDKLLEQIIVLKFPETITWIPRLEEELKNCQTQAVKANIFSLSNVLHPAEIRYAGYEYEEQESIDGNAFAEDIAALSEPENLYL